ncbi:RhoGAP domain containing protein [Trichomonas vaginalis G3]|uniref:RhoGAP domain containing protein n=1 Tax=Trichomonas vaginalis (strain ATCC PRA-98 / G3) TaxID=412133 RepID=A2DJ04_TRIV3|nr:Rho GTPase-activating protein 68f family [Trichomonas vaginalis G3]EAY19579.1 RhoGAP domain containing protein [Trichomonas vaginalis G3]KAI5515908.1 Rho GTPase-activating protein 68f family [Trichomonas vaginalis G3]|eukprot:XP_001580565.1 RhoGAP domain containing protein [Trichomonas vaginalis G3]
MGIWGKNLTAVFMQTRRAVPRFLESCMSYVLEKYVDEEGIFRIPGDVNKKTAIRQFADATDTFDENLTTSPFEVCNVITQFIRDIPDSILMNSNLQTVIEIYDVNDAKDFVNTLYFINRALFSRIIAFFTLITKHPSNRMNASNIAIILSPILICDPQNPAFILPKNIIEIFLNHYDEVFSTIPALLPNGEWMPSEQYEKSLGDLTESFFCQSTYINPKISSMEDVEKKLEPSEQICRNISIDEDNIGHILKFLLCSDRDEMAISEQILENL